MWGYYILIVFMILIIILIIKTILFKKTLDQRSVEHIDVDEQKVLQALIKKIKIPTVSYRDSSLINQDAFKAFKSLLQTDYPLVNQHATYKEIGTGVLFHIKGKSKEKPIVLMAHFDVVPTSSNWSVEPFSGLIKNGYLYGRGTLDTKVTVNAIMESMVMVLRNNKWLNILNKIILNLI